MHITGLELHSSTLSTRFAELGGVIEREGIDMIFLLGLVILKDYTLQSRKESDQLLAGFVQEDDTGCYAKIKKRYMIT